MNAHDVLLNNPKFLALTVFSLIEDEKKRISENKLANKEQWLSSIKPITEAIAKSAEQHKDWRVAINHLSGLHNLLKSIKVPGDFEKYAEEEFYIVLDLPAEEGPIKDDKRECEKCEECDECHECEEDEKDDEGTKEQGILSKSVNVLLQKLANLLGDEGNHEAAYLVERTIRSINSGL